MLEVHVLAQRVRTGVSWSDDGEESAYARDRSCVANSTALHALRGKTQIMGGGDVPCHRTRLTHSFEVLEIALCLVHRLRRTYQEDAVISAWLPPAALVETACLAHDIGHPPFGHEGERALHHRMRDNGGFEANAQTLRELTRLEASTVGFAPTRRTILSVLKYGLPYSAYPHDQRMQTPPKCYFDADVTIVEEALSGFAPHDRRLLAGVRPIEGRPEPLRMTLDASIVDMADDIANAVYDLKDLADRDLLTKADLCGIAGILTPNRPSGNFHRRRKALIAELTPSREQFVQGVLALKELLIANVALEKVEEFEHPLLRYRAAQPPQLGAMVDNLKAATGGVIMAHPAIRAKDRLGRSIVEGLYDTLLQSPERLALLSRVHACSKFLPRRIADVIAGMTDRQAEQAYEHLVGESRSD